MKDPRKCSLAAALIVTAVVISLATIFIYLRQEARFECTRWREDFLIASANMDKALANNDRGMVKALGEEFGDLLLTQPEGCGRPPRRL